MSLAPASPIDALRQAILDDGALQRELACETGLEPFLNRCAAIAARVGLPVGRDAIAAALEPAAHSPLLLPPPPALAGAPPRQWLPGEMLAMAGEPAIEWLYFGERGPTEAFYSQSIARVRALPINRLLRFRSPAAALPGLTLGPPPDGFVFHMSRCGSTLVSQMLAAMPGAISISEAPVIEAVARVVLAGRLPREALRGIIGALTRDRQGAVTYRFVKFLSSHVLLIPLLRELFPDTPWVFLYRDPVEVLISQIRMPSPEVLAGIPPSELPEGAADELRHAREIAMMIGRFVESALSAFPAGGGIAIDYRALPAAVETAILPHFGIAPDDDARRLMALSAALDVKRVGQPFRADSAAKQAEASAELRAIAEEFMGPPIRRLQTFG